MQVFYDHVVSKQADMDLNFMLVSAWVDEGEESQALASGWIPTWFYINECKFVQDSIANNKEVWCQLRSSRINCETFKPKNKHLKALNDKNFRYEYKKRSECENIKNQLLEIYKKYIANKQYKDSLSDKDYYKFIFEDSSDVILFYYKDKIVACTYMRKYKNEIISDLFTWDYQDYKLSLGNLSNYLEVELCKRNGFKYLYIGPYSEAASKYKASIKGIEVWTGRKWISDKKKLLQIAESDERVSKIEDLLRYKDFQKLLDF
jgi:arginyl-tRNA--protein-N-Asp/Glu arginylyltransferase